MLAHSRCIFTKASSLSDDEPSHLYLLLLLFRYSPFYYIITFIIISRLLLLPQMKAESELTEGLSMNLQRARCWLK